MRWPIIRLIWFRELRDQLRDRRTVFMIAVLPILLYPVAGFGVVQLASGFVNQKGSVGVVGLDHLLPWQPGGLDPAPAVAWLALTPPGPGAPLAGPASVAAAAGLARAHPRRPYPPLLRQRAGRPAFLRRYLDPGVARNLTLVSLPGPAPGTPAPDFDPQRFLAEVDRGPLVQRKVDLLLVAPPNFQERLARGERPLLFVLTREKDEHSRLVNVRVTGALNRWKKDLLEVRLVRRGLPPRFDDPFEVDDPERAKPAGKREEEGLFGVLVRVFPFVLVMWSLAGALYPAVDLCAGEKERGTMETLLISPAGREEIVWGKFLTIWVFSAATALLNLLSMGLTTWQFSAALSGAGFHPAALFWGVVLLLPLSAFFSAVCLAIGAYARSSKEGQYYLMPLFLLTMPLIFLTLAPGVELNPFYSMVPVTGVALLLQLMVAEPGDRGLWLYFVPVLAPMVIYSWLALRWAIGQFQREGVLFREAERLDLGLWLRRLLRDKEPLPSAGEAFFCFGLLLALGWLSFSVGTHLSLLARTSIRHLAFVAAPPLFLAVLLTTRPARGLGLRIPLWWAWPAAVALAGLVLPPLAELTRLILRQFPGLQTLLEQNHPLTSELNALGQGPLPWDRRVRFFLVLALLPALSEELAFRGFILSGLRRAFRPGTAVLLSSFLFALFQMNVFQFAPHFLLGAVLGLLSLRGGVLPAMTFHLVYNTLLITPNVLWPEAFGRPDEGAGFGPLSRALLSAVCAGLAAGVLLAVWRAGRAGERG